ncbi:type II toxin-antitoxin system PemK/MazF family toxin [Vibrio vulnificus]|uniref:type II toxin-antitoxin system PemK/MazF family toxin n=1 Tax=Vibrio vulnificus TaxID=672 RepID=UPI004059AAE8
MARTHIQGNVKIGHLYDCIFGEFKSTGQGTTTDKNQADEYNYNHRIPNEMIKKRLVVVVGKHKGQYIVVPISATKEEAKRVEKEPEYQGFHVKLLNTDIPATERYPYGVERWAKCNLISTIDGGRLRDLPLGQGKGFVAAQKVSDATLRKIREGVIIAIGMRDILVTDQDNTDSNSANDTIDATVK